MPLRAEGRKRITQAAKGLEEMKNSVDSLLIINNENIREVYGNLAYTEAFGKADDILATAARSISGIVSQHSYINSDMEDVKSIMRNSGVSLMCMAECETGKSLIDAMKEALKSPLLNHNDIRGAQNILAHVRCGKEEISLNELCSIMDDLQVMTTGGEFDTEEGNLGADLIWGAGMDNTLGDKNCVTIIATHFKTEVDVKSDVKKNEKRSQATAPKIEKEVI
jgi:cell division protein FtsZ